MTVRRIARALAYGLMTSVLLWPALITAQTPQPAGQDQGVPTDLRPLLAPHQSEMRLVTLRYTADRNTLSANYGVTGRGGAGVRPAAGADAIPASLSPNRVARLKRFDLDWQTALGRIDATRLSPAAQADLEALEKT